MSKVGVTELKVENSICLRESNPGLSAPLASTLPLRCHSYYKHALGYYNLNTALRQAA